MVRKLDVLLLLPLVVLCAKVLPAQTAAVAALQQAMAQPGVQVRLTISGVHATHQVQIRPIDNRIINGTVAKRVADSFRGSDDQLLLPGTLVSVAKVAGVDGQGKYDFLRLTVTAPNGAQALLAWQLAPNSLAGMTMQQLQALVGQALTLPGGTPQPAQGDRLVASRNTPSPPAAWQPAPIQDEGGFLHGAAAFSLMGRAEAGLQAAPVRLTLQCGQAYYQGKPAPEASFTTQFDVPARLIDFNMAPLVEMDSRAGDGISQLGDDAPIDIDAAIGPDDDGKKGIWNMGLGYNWRDLQPIVNSPGKHLTITVGRTEGKGHDLVAHFDLPENADALQAKFMSCFATQAVLSAQQEASHLVSCPVLPGHYLDSISFPDRQKFATPGEDTMNISYDLAHGTKNRPRPVLTMTCEYAPNGSKEPTHANLELRQVKVPQTATYCVAIKETTVTRREGYCN